MQRGVERESLPGDERHRHRDEEARREQRLADAQEPFAKRPRPCSGSDEAPFIWRKKAEILRKKGIDPEAQQKRQAAELHEELRAAKRRREQREQERAEWEAQQAELARQKEAHLNDGWHRTEASFHGRQHFLRQAIRLRERRPAGTDALAAFVRLDVAGGATGTTGATGATGALDVRQFLAGLDAARLRQLADGVEEELDFVADFDGEQDNAVWNRRVRLQFWQCVRVCVRDRLQLLDAGEREGLPSAVAADVELLLRGKSMSKLREMETEIDMKLKLGGEADGAFGEVDFWHAALARIRERIASERLREITEMLWIERQEREAKEPREEKGDAPAVKRDSRQPSAGDERAREQAAGLVHLPGEDDEEEFKDEVDAPGQGGSGSTSSYAWNDKYRPRKPKYLNKVLSGYRWTKYNRTHYDHDNPPPKTVQGYMFNIFYPDLMDASKTPTFSISKTDNAEVVIITFHAGPPYQDIAFKIVNRPWVTSHRRGYRCSFDKGVLQLWFNFDRYYYRR